MPYPWKHCILLFRGLASTGDLVLRGHCSCRERIWQFGKRDLVPGFFFDYSTMFVHKLSFTNLRSLKIFWNMQQQSCIGYRTHCQGYYIQWEAVLAEKHHFWSSFLFCKSSHGYLVLVIDIDQYQLHQISLVIFFPIPIAHAVPISIVLIVVVCCAGMYWVSYLYCTSSPTFICNFISCATSSAYFIGNVFCSFCAHF